MQSLRNGKSVSEVCDAVGFESLSSFSGLFKRIVGVTPSVFLTQQQILKEQILKNPLKFVPSCFVFQNGWVKK